MIKSETAQSKRIYLKDITSYGSHINMFEGTRGYALSLLHWSPKYDETSLHMRYVEWAQQPPPLNPSEYQSYEFNNFFANLDFVKTNHSQEFKNANNRHIARILDTFNQSENRVVHSIFIAYFNLIASSNPFDIDAFISATKKILSENKDQNPISLSSIESSLADQLLKATQFSPKLKKIMIDGIIWALALDLVKFSVGPFAGACASLILTFASPAFKHICEKKTFYGTTEAITNSWNQRILDDNSFHPLVEIIIRSSWVRATWPYIDQLPNIAKSGSLLHTMIAYGIVNFVLKYSTQNAFNTLKTELHKATSFETALYKSAKAATVGAIRGLIRNSLTPYTSWNRWDFVTASISLFCAQFIMHGLKNPAIVLKNFFDHRNLLSIIVALFVILYYNFQAFHLWLIPNPGFITAKFA